MVPSQVFRTIAALRWGLILGLFTVYLPWSALAGFPLNSMTGGLFAEQDPLAILGLAAFIGLSSLTIVWTQGLLLDGIVRDRRSATVVAVLRWFLLGWRSALIALSLSLLAVVPLILRVAPSGINGNASFLDHCLGLLAAVAGLFLAYLFAILAAAPAVLTRDESDLPLPGRPARWLSSKLRALAPAQWLARQVVGLLSRVARKLMQDLLEPLPEGAADRAHQRLREPHEIAGSFALISAAGLLLIAGIGAPPHPWIAMTPAIFLYSLLITLAWTLGFIHYRFDRWGLSPITVIVALVLLGYGLSGADHRYELLEAPEADLDEAPTCRAAISGTTETAMSERNLVIVAASGGGIQAAGWTVRVLEEALLRRPELWQSRELAILSGASGGAVGIAFLLDALSERGLSADAKERTAQLAGVFEDATKSSLGAVAYGLSFRDLPTLLRLGFFAPERDRGWLLESQWAENSRVQRRRELRLSDVQARLLRPVAEGFLPIPIFNATAMESGRRIMITPLQFERPLIPTDFGAAAQAGVIGNSEQRAYSFAEYLKGPDGRANCDLHLWTAARLSATFPYVTPAARANREGGPEALGHHFIDGGYSDNFGVASAIDTLQELLADGRPLPKRVALIEIRTFPFRAPTTEEPAQGSLSALIGPIIGLFRIRDGVAKVQNGTAIASLKRELSAKNVAFESFIFQPDSTEARRAPLTWHLTKSQRQSLRAAFQPAVQGQELERLQRFLKN